MMVDKSQTDRLLLAERWLELAEHSSEIEMRNSLSRMYYAVHHVAIALTGEANHGRIPAELERCQQGLGKSYKNLAELRSWADYTPAFVPNAYVDRDNFKNRFPEDMEAARELYEKLLGLVRQRDDT